jgi:bifunctional pyridoxal-dependent enzyme with beta-cystathionase and maltose regulon repressor activities
MAYGFTTCSTPLAPSCFECAAARYVFSAAAHCCQVFTREELQLVADLCIQHDTYALSDEVWLLYMGGSGTELMRQSAP